MYSIYFIYQSDKLVHITYQDFNSKLSNLTKLDIIFKSPTVPFILFENYFKSPELFSITTYKTNIHNALEASQIVQNESKLIGTDKPSIKPSTPKSTPKKPRTKKKVEAVED